MEIFKNFIFYTYIFGTMEWSAIFFYQDAEQYVKYEDFSEAVNGDYQRE